MHNHRTLGQKKAAEQLIARILTAGYRISVYDGEEWAIKRNVDPLKIIDAMGNTDSDTLRLTKLGNVIGDGNIFLVWGNADDGSDLVSDYTATLEIDALIHAHWAERGDV